MSDLATHAKLARPCAQLPVDVYFDDALLQREMQQLFQAGPRYALSDADFFKLLCIAPHIPARESGTAR